MKINLLIDTFTDTNVLQKEIVKCIYGNLEVEQTVASKAMEDINELLLKEHDLVQRFIIDDIEYGFIPNLSKITAGEFIDLDNYMSSEPKQLHKICAILYRPVTDSFSKLYEIEKYQGTDKLADIMLKVDSKIALGALLFFYNLSNSLLRHTNIFIEKETKRIVKNRV